MQGEKRVLGRVATAHRERSYARAGGYVCVCVCTYIQRVHARECKQPECLSTRRNRKLLGEHASSAALRAPSGATAQEIRVKRFGDGSEREVKRGHDSEICINKTGRGKLATTNRSAVLESRDSRARSGARVIMLIRCYWDELYPRKH